MEATVTPELAKRWAAYEDYVAKAKCTRPKCPMCTGYHYVHKIEASVLNELTDRVIEAIKAEPIE